MQLVLVQATSLGKGRRTSGGNVMLDAMSGLRGINFRGEHGRVGGEERVKLSRTGLKRGKQWRGVGGGGRKQWLQGEESRT